MSSMQIIQPGSNVLIVPFSNDPLCTNREGVVIEARSRRCCDVTQGIPCTEYLVRYEFKTCNHCSFQETWFCASEIEDLNP